MGLPIRTRPSFPLSRSLPSGSFHKPHAYPSEGRQTENHNHRRLTNLITWTTALSNSVKLWAMPCRASQDRWVVVESSDKMWSTGEGNGKPLQYSCLDVKLRVVNQEMASVNVDISRISELKWTGTGKLNSDDRYIYYCGQNSLRRHKEAVIVNKRAQNTVLRRNLKNNRMISVHFQGKPFNNPSLFPNW